jgi:hypothetical protein
VDILLLVESLLRILLFGVDCWIVSLIYGYIAVLFYCYFDFNAISLKRKIEQNGNTTMKQYNNLTMQLIIIALRHI